MADEKNLNEQVNNTSENEDVSRSKPMSDEEWENFLAELSIEPEIPF